MGLVGNVRVLLRPKHDLSEAFPIAEIYKCDAAMIARNVHPAGKGHLLADVAFPQCIAVVRPVHARSLWANRPFWQAVWCQRVIRESVAVSLCETCIRRCTFGAERRSE